MRVGVRVGRGDATDAKAEVRGEKISEGVKVGALCSTPASEWEFGCRLRGAVAVGRHVMLAILAR